MAAADITTLTTSFTSAIGDMSTPVLTIMGAGVGITVIFSVYKLVKRAFKKSVD